MIVAINLLYLVPPIYRAKWDHDVIEIERKSIDYFKHNTVTGVVIAIMDAIIYFTASVPLWDTIKMSLAVHWLIFDYLLNWFRRRPVLSYYGDLNDVKNLSFIERHVYRRVGWRVLLVAKILFFIYAIYTYGS